MSIQETVFNFEVDGAPELRVTQFRGQESISDLFRFDIDLVSPDPNVDFESVFNRSARLLIRDAKQERLFEGVLCTFEQVDDDSRVASYRASLVPILWLLTLSQRSAIYQEQTVPDIVKAVLKEHGFTSDDYEFRLTRTYVSREYVVQYQETDFNFVSRWLEHEGIFYFFSGRKLILVDNSAMLQPIPGEPSVVYRPPAGLESVGVESVHGMVVRQQMLPAEVLLKDYNWRKPQLDLKAPAKVVGAGRGRVMEYGNHYKDGSEASRLAQTRAEEIRCRHRSIEGQSDCWRLGSGHRFKLADHPRRTLNREYLLTEVDHFGSQMGEVDTTGSDEGHSQGVEYSNRFVCIPSEANFRPLRKTPKPKLFGTMNAKVDGAGDSSYAEIDEQGRYKVTLPFDISGKGGGKASRYIRMAQPYAGSDYGMHFPLHKGVEVVLTMIDGDPDRPIICGAVPNPDTASPVTAANHKSSVIRDYGGNEIVLDGTEGNQQVRIHSPKHKSTIVLGNSIVESTESDHKIHIGGAREDRVDKSVSVTVGDSKTQKVASAYLLEAGSEVTIRAASKITLSCGGSTIEMTPTQISINSPLVKINC